MSSIQEILNFNVPEDLAHNIIMLWCLLVVAPVSSALIMWTILPALAGWIWPMISL